LLLKFLFALPPGGFDGLAGALGHYKQTEVVWTLPNQGRWPEV